MVGEWLSEKTKNLSIRNRDAHINRTRNRSSFILTDRLNSTKQFKTKQKGHVDTPNPKKDTPVKHPTMNQETNSNSNSNGNAKPIADLTGSNAPRMICSAPNCSNNCEYRSNFVRYCPACREEIMHRMQPNCAALSLSVSKAQLDSYWNRLAAEQHQTNKFAFGNAVTRSLQRVLL